MFKVLNFKVSISNHVFFLDNKTSISSQYLRNGTSSRNVDIINATKQTKKDPETVKKREELAKRIADTKKKLETVCLFIYLLIFCQKYIYFH